MNDDEIINLFLKRDENGIIELSTKYHPYCYKIAWNLLANREDAEDWGDDDFVEIGETTEAVEEVPEDTLEEKNPSDAEDQVETQIIGGADAPTEVRLQDDTDQKENTDAADKTDEDYGTEESAYYDGATGEITAESGWTPVGDKIRIQIK